MEFVMRAPLAILLLLWGTAYAEDAAPDPALVAAVKGYLAADTDGARVEAAKALAPFKSVHVDALSAALGSAVTWPKVEGPITKKLKIRKGEITYFARLPKDYDPEKTYGLLYWIFGPGTDGNLAFKTWTPEKLGGKYVVASVTMPPDDPNWPGYPDYDTADLTFEAVLNDLMRTVHLDSDRVFVGGFSMGANFAWSVAALQPDRLAGAVPGSGRQPDTAIPDVMRNIMWCPAYATHGAAEKETPVEMARDLVKKLRGFGYSVIYKEIPKMGHEWPAALEPEIVKWMDGHKRTRDPAKLYHALRWWERSGRRFYWLTLVRGTIHGELDAKIQGNTVTIRSKQVDTVDLDLNERLLDLDQEVRVVVNGETVFRGKVERDVRQALDDFRVRWDAADLHNARLVVHLP